MSARDVAPAAAGGRPALLVHGALWGLPSACPCCIRAEAYLCLAAFSHDCVECPAQITSCELPALEDYPTPPTHPPPTPDPPASSSAPSADSPSGPPASPPPTDPADSGTPASADPPAGSSAPPRARRSASRPLIALSSASSSAVEDYLRAHRGVDLDAALSPAEHAELTALRGLVETILSAAAQAELWGEESNRGALREMFDSAVPWPLSRALLWREARNHRWGEAEPKAHQGEGGADGRGSGAGGALARAGVRSREELFARAAAAYSALATRLGDAPLFFDPRPSSLDAALYAHLIFVTQAPLVKSQLQQLVSSHAPLRAFLSAMTNRLTTARAALSEGSAVPPPLSRPFAPSRGAGRKEPRAQTSTESSKPRSSAWMFVVAQVAAIIGYIVMSSVSVDLGEEDEEEEEESRSGRRHGGVGSARGGLRGHEEEREEDGGEGDEEGEEDEIDDDDDDE
ncbi:hypothetical protein CLOM_g21187 [Closterium sp. NIES-68]|nr:hypothetical protein CLOM_g21187 [Closterium sp. NIES-68]